MSDERSSAADCALPPLACVLADPQPSLFGLYDLAHVDNPVQAIANPIPGIARMVLGPLPVGQPPGPLYRPRRLRILAISQSGSHFVAPTVIYDGRVDTLISSIRRQMDLHPLVHHTDPDVVASCRHLQSIKELNNPQNWHLWFDSPSAASPWVWQWAALMTQSTRLAGAEDPQSADPIELITCLGTVRLQHCVSWALDALSPTPKLLAQRIALPQALLQRLLEQLAARQPGDRAHQHLRQALATLPLGQLRWLADETASGQRLFDALCSGESLPKAIRRECPAATPAALRHAARCAPIVPDAPPSTWRLLLQALPTIGRHRWPASSSQWTRLVDIVHRAEVAADRAGFRDAPGVVLDAVAVAVQHEKMGYVPKAIRWWPHWATAYSCSEVPDVTSLVSQLVGFRSAVERAIRMTAPPVQPSRGAGEGCSDEQLLARLMAAFAQSTNGAFVREVAALLTACPAATIGTLAVDLVRTPAEAAQAGACLENCLSGAGKWRFADYLLDGVLVARITDGERLAGLFTIQINLAAGRAGIRAKTSNPKGARNSSLPRRLNTAARQYARMLEEGGFGLDRYAMIVRAVESVRPWAG